MTWKQVQFWLECIAYDVELMTEAAQREGSKETLSLDDLVRTLPREEKKE